jgi:hypothetical protein
VRERLVLLLIAAVAVTACADSDDPVEVTETEACKAVKEKLELRALTDRFGEPDRSQDFFGDRVVTYDDGEQKWQFQVSAQAGTFRAIRVEGSKEEILAC